MPSAFDLSFLASRQRPAPAWDLETIDAEMADAFRLGAGFDGIEAHAVAATLWSRVARSAA